MPLSNATAAAELSDLIHEGRFTRKMIATHMSVTESWLSRRLSTAVPMQIDEYNAIKKAVQELAASLVHQKTPGVAAPGVQR